MEDLNATYEYVVSAKHKKQFRLYRVLLILGYIVWVLAFIIIGIISKLGIPLIALVPMSTWIIVWFTWKYVDVEYEYSMTSGGMVFSKIYGSRSRKQIYDFRIKDFKIVAPADSEEHKLSDFEKGNFTITDFSSDTESPDCYFAVTENDKNQRIVILFEATSQALRILRNYNPQAVKIKNVRY